MSTRVLTPEQKARRLEMQRKRMAASPEAREKARLNSLEWARNNKERKAEYDKQKRTENPEAYSQRYRDYYLKNKEQRTAEIRASNAARKERIRRQALARVYAQEIKAIYVACPPGHHVDHVVPLRGEAVSGLHVPWNLQYLPAVDNLKKGNAWQS